MRSSPGVVVVRDASLPGSLYLAGVKTGKIKDLRLCARIEQAGYGYRVSLCFCVFLSCTLFYQINMANYAYISINDT